MASQPDAPATPASGRTEALKAVLDDVGANASSGRRLVERIADRYGRPVPAPVEASREFDSLLAAAERASEAVKRRLITAAIERHLTEKNATVSAANDVVSDEPVPEPAGPNDVTVTARLNVAVRDELATATSKLTPEQVEARWEVLVRQLIAPAPTPSPANIATPDLGTSTWDLSSDVETRHALSLLRDGLGDLPIRMQVVVIGHYLEGRSIDELATQTRMTRARVRALLTRALELLREFMEANYQSSTSDGSPPEFVIDLRSDVDLDRSSDKP